MAFAVLSYWARATVGVALLLTAIWKWRNQAEFRSAYRAAAPQPVRGLAAVAAVAIPLAELACAAALLVPAELGRWATPLALALLVLFTIALTRVKDLTAGCGCWRSAPGPTNRNLFLVRNLLLLTLAVVGSLGTTGLELVQALAVLPMAVLFALIILELPTIGAMVLSERGERAAR
jgi:Methylamine utilisation protein MauE